MSRKKKQSVEEEVTNPFEDAPEEVVEAPEEVVAEKALVRCPDCPFRAGLTDESTVCGTCNGSGQVEAEPLE